MVRAFQDNAIDLEIVGVHHVGKRVFIPRIPMAPLYDLTSSFQVQAETIPDPTEFCNDDQQKHRAKPTQMLASSSRAYFLTWTALCHAVKWCIETNDKNFGQTKEISRSLGEEHQEYCV
jgi:hypothetical protein